MKTQFLLLLFFPFSFIYAQNYFAIRMGYASPAGQFRSSSYDKNNHVFGCTFYKDLLENKHVSWRWGFGFDATLGKTHKYNLQNGDLSIKNILCPLYVSTRIDYNIKKLKPFAEYSLGLLFSGPAESFKENSNTTTIVNSSPANNQSQSSNSQQGKGTGFGKVSTTQLLTLGCKYPLSDNIYLELSYTYQLCRAIQFMDYSKVYANGDNLFVHEIGNLSHFGMNYFRVGLFFKVSSVQNDETTTTPVSDDSKTNNNSRTRSHLKRGR